MHTYWRIIEELKYLGEGLVFHDPSLKRCYEEWVCKKAEVLSMLETDDEKKPLPFLRVLRRFQNVN